MTTDREAILQTAIDHMCGDRNEAYGEPSRQMQLTWDMWMDYRNNAAGKYCGAHDAAMFLAINKLSRIAFGNEFKSDHYVDLAAYIAIAFEAELEFHQNLPTTTTDPEPEPLDKVGV